MARTVADQLVAGLIDAGVTRIYGIVGDSLNPVVDAVRRSGGSAKGGIDWVHVRHEEAAAFAASADAQTSGGLAVCAGSCGPGNLHLINGLYDAHRSGAPVLAIASHIPSTEIGTGYFQETHPDRIFGECSLFNELVSTPEQAPRMFRSAIQSAITGSGVAVVTLPGDIAEQPAAAALAPVAVSPRAVITPPAEVIERLAEAINGAAKVAIFVGYGVRGAHDEVIALAERSERRSDTRCAARNSSSTTTRSTSG
jgi:pyruvate dehydrogenase (quinone)